MLIEESTFQCCISEVVCRSWINTQLVEICNLFDITQEVEPMKGAQKQTGRKTNMVKGHGRNGHKKNNVAFVILTIRLRTGVIK